MPSAPLLLPFPRLLSLKEGVFDIPSQALIVINQASLLFEGQYLQSALSHWTKFSWEIVAGAQYPNTGITLQINEAVKHPQGYQLTISSSEIVLSAGDASGIFYGICTLNQLLQQYPVSLPCLAVDDWPDFPARGVMLDISRDKVPKLETVLDLVNRLASLKINQLQLYMEHTFAYRRHPEVWAQATPFTGEDILKLDAYCRERHIELVPNQNSLGHFERWLKHERYHHLAECPEGFEPPWGGHSPATTLNPVDPGSMALVAELYDELLPHFGSSSLNVGGDEPWELGKGKSKVEVEGRGGRVYLDYITKLHQEVTVRGHKMQFWGDIIVHYPDLVAELPPDITAMLWGYEGGDNAAQEWERQCTLLRGAGIPFYVCPGTSSWNSGAGRTSNMIDNCRISAISGLKHGAVGYLNTDWGDNGHWQPLSVSYLGFAYGAGVSWCLDTNVEIDLPVLLDAFIFEDRAGVIGEIAYDLGEVYKIIGPEHINGQVLAYALQLSRQNLNKGVAGYERWGGSKAQLTPETLHSVIQTIDTIMLPLSQADMKRPDANTIRAEFQQAADLLRHSAHRLLFIIDEEGSPITLRDELYSLLDRQRELWLTRNRPGGLEDSLRRFNTIQDEYERLVKS